METIKIFNYLFPASLELLLSFLRVRFLFERALTRRKRVFYNELIENRLRKKAEGDLALQFVRKAAICLVDIADRFDGAAGEFVGAWHKEGSFAHLAHVSGDEHRAYGLNDNVRIGKLFTQNGGEMIDEKLQFHVHKRRSTLQNCFTHFARRINRPVEERMIGSR